MTFFEFVDTLSDVVVAPLPQFDPCSARPVLNTNTIQELIRQPKPGSQQVRGGGALLIWLDQKPDLEKIKGVFREWARTLGDSIPVEIFPLRSAMGHICLVGLKKKGTITLTFGIEIFAQGTRIAKNFVGNRQFLELPNNISTEMQDVVQDVKATQRALDDCFFDEGDNPQVADYCILVEKYEPAR